jgi:ParB-like chromosome segregation protein Spo0J
MTLSFAPERIETWPLARLQPYAKNAKVHGPDQVAKIAASMAEFGWTVPCLVGEDGELIAGHGRVLAATQLGLTEAPVIVLGHLTEAQRRAYRIADNKLTELGSWDEALLSAELQDLLADDYDLSLVGFSDGELDKLLAFDPDGGGEEEGGAGGSVPPVTIPEPPRNPASRTGDLWILGDHRLLCGDSTSHDDVRRLMNGERAVLFATDPPYLVDYDGSNHPTRNKDWSRPTARPGTTVQQGAELYDGFIAAAVAEAITEDAAWYCWHASRRQAMLEACWEKAGAFVHQQIIWVKDRGVLTRSHYLWKHEPCFMGWRRPNRPPKVAEQTLPSTWEMPSFAKDERPTTRRRNRSTPSASRCASTSPAAGSATSRSRAPGSQIMAGEANGRRVFAMEISPAYVDVAVERWQAETGKRRDPRRRRPDLRRGEGRAAGRDPGRGRGGPRGLTTWMAWLYLPPDCLPEPATRASSASRSAPAPAGSTSGCTSHAPDIALWVTSSGTPTPRPSSWRGWKTRPWIRRLSGTTLPPSTAARGAARWTSSLRAIRASRSPSRASAGARTTRATSGRMSPASSASANRPSCSSRMSPIISASASPKSPEDWSAWATALRQASSRRRKSARPTSASGSSSSPTASATTWPTPRACSGTRSSGGNRTGDDAPLADAAGGRQQGDAEPDEQSQRDGAPAQRRDDALRCDAAVDDADGAGSQGRGDEPREHAGERAAWPPGPGDADGWREFLRHAPDLEPAVRRGADGLAHRVDRLRLCGNGVVPLVAAHALRTLAAQLLADG